MSEGETVQGGNPPRVGRQPPSINTDDTHSSTQDGAEKRGGNMNSQEFDDMRSPISPQVVTLNPWSRKNTSLDVADYFAGPRDMAKHSKWPIFLRMHGSILPKMIVPLLFVAAWATTITCLDNLVPGVDLDVSSILLTVTGFVVGLGLSFRSSTAYERYAEGRKYWTAVILASNNIGRGIWVHAKEPNGKRDVLAKVTAMNLLVAFAVSLKHKLRWEPYAEYDDLCGLIGHLDTLAMEATAEDNTPIHRTRPGFFKATGEYLGIPFAASNPRKELKRAKKPLGNIPLEILTYLGAYCDVLSEGDCLPVGMTQTLLYNSIAMLNDSLTGCERVATTPMPIAYQIAISQITWVYLLFLPFQLLQLGWVAIPAAITASYIILGILMIGNEIEDPFGQDVNDLPLDEYCAQVATELDIIASRPRGDPSKWITDPRNKPMFPLSSSGYDVWASRSEAKIRGALKRKTELGMEDDRTRSREGTEDTVSADERV